MVSLVSNASAINTTDTSESNAENFGPPASPPHGYSIDTDDLAIEMTSIPTPSGRDVACKFLRNARPIVSQKTSSQVPSTPHYFIAIQNDFDALPLISYITKKRQYASFLIMRSYVRSKQL